MKEMKEVKAIRFLMVAVAALLFSVSYADAQMMGQEGGEGMMGKGKGMMGDKMGMMGKGGSGMMGGGMGMMPCMGMGQGMMMGSMGMGQMRGGLRLFLANAEALGLSDEQVKKIDAIKQKVTKEHILDEAKLKVARIELGELLEEDTVNMKKVEKKVKEIVELKEKLMLTGIKAGVEGKGILTKEQRVKAKKLMIENKEECMMMQGRGAKSGMGMMGGAMPGGSEGDKDEIGAEGKELQEEEGHEEHH